MDLQHQRERVELDFADIDLASVFGGDEAGCLECEQSRHAKEAEHRVRDEQRDAGSRYWMKPGHG